MRAHILAGVLVVVSVANAVMQEGGIERVRWLQGCWESVSPQRTIEEQWMAPRGRSMVGISRTIRGDALVEYELMVLREQADRLSFEAHPSGQSSAVFVSRTISDASVLFENLQHDFPQRIGYQRSGPNTLLAWVEGTEKGQTRRVDFSYRRAACGGN